MTIKLLHPPPAAICHACEETVPLVFGAKCGCGKTICTQMGNGPTAPLGWTSWTPYGGDRRD